jgi:hypothetical protein
MVSLCFTAIMAPFEVAFLDTKLDVLFCINRVIDAVFLVVRAAAGGRKTLTQRVELRLACHSAPAAPRTSSSIC